MFQQYTASAIEKIHHPPAVIECKSNMDKADNEDNHDLDVYIPSVKRKLPQIMNVDHWTKQLLNDI